MTQSNDGHRSAPWVSGPVEVLQHGLELLGHDSDRNRRLAIIAIDNAVELAIRTYLGLPRRVTGLALTRKVFAEVVESFPALLDTLEQYAPEKLQGINLGEIEWYHRVRNELYHQGNGLTVERDKVEVYAYLAKVLFQNLFDVSVSDLGPGGRDLLGDFLSAWIRVEQAVSALASRHTEDLGEWSSKSAPWQQVLSILERAAVLPPGTADRLHPFGTLRNQVVHGQGDYHKLLNRETIREILAIADLIERAP